MSRFDIVDATLKSELPKPYALGQSDCFLMGMAMVDAIKGTDHVSFYQGRYNSLTGAKRVLRGDGHKDLASLLQALDLGRIAPLQAIMGDIAVIGVEVKGKKPVANHVGVHNGRGWVVKADSGVLNFDSAQAMAAFRVL